MLRYIGQRLFLMGITLFLIIACSFAIVHSTPGGAFSSPDLPAEVAAVMEAKYHLNEPLPVQFAYYIKNVLQLDFGVSLKVQPKRNVFDIIKEKMPITIILNVFSFLLVLPSAFFFGIVSALKRNTIIDHAISVMVVIFISVPSFVFASLMRYFLSYKLGLFPIILSTSQEFNWELMHSMILPILALSFGGIASITRYLRAELIEALNSDYMLLAKTKGLTQIQAVMSHAIRNSLVPVVGILVGMFFALLSGSMVIENIFAIPGLGRLSIEAINAADYSLVIASITMYALIGLVARLFVDLSYGIIDPRIRIGGGKNTNE